MTICACTIHVCVLDIHIRIGSSSEMQDKIDDLQRSSDDNDTRQMEELHEDSDASMKGK